MANLVDQHGWRALATLQLRHEMMRALFRADRDGARADRAYAERFVYCLILWRSRTKRVVRHIAEARGSQWKTLPPH
jgi:hypothetical protein